MALFKLPDKPIGLRWRSATSFILVTVAIGLFTDLFLYGLIVPILPFLLRDRVDLPDDKVQSYVSGLLAAYAGASVVCSLPAGFIADKVKTRQAPFLSGLVALLGATILLAFGQSIPVLIVARVLQGISAAFVWTVGLAMVLDTVGPGDLGKVIGSVCIASKVPHDLSANSTLLRYSLLSALENSPPQSLEASSTKKPATVASLALVQASSASTSSFESSSSRRK